MEINKDLNLVIPVERSDEKVFAYSTPVGRAVIEAYHHQLAKAYSELTGDNINVQACLATAALALKEASGDKWDAVERGLMGEIRRLTSICAPGLNGWETYLLPDAVKRGVIDEDEAREVENVIVFFTCILLVFRKSEIPMMLSMFALRDVEFTSSTVTEYLASLQTSTETGDSSPPAGLLVTV